MPKISLLAIHGLTTVSDLMNEKLKYTGVIQKNKNIFIVITKLHSLSHIHISIQKTQTETKKYDIPKYQITKNG